jgi:hypothetical protein
MLPRLVDLACARFDRFMRHGLRRVLMRRGGLDGVDTGELERRLAGLARYNAPDVLADPDRLLAPPGPAELTARLTRPLRDGAFHHFTFPSPYTPHDPDYAREYAGYDNVGTVHLHAWRHVRPAPASIVLAHGWCVGHRRLHEIEFNIAKLYRELGLDVYFYVQPFHSLRKPTAARFSGELFPSTDLVRTNEAFIQTCRDLRAAIGAILQYNPAPLGMMGSSLGGYTSALIASIDPRLAFVAPIMAPASFADLFWDHGEGDPFRSQAEALGMTRERFHDAWALHSPLSYTPKVPWERRLIISARGDALVTEAHADVLWHHWQRPRRFRFTGGHFLQVGRRGYIHELGRFLASLAILPGY